MGDREGAVKVSEKVYRSELTPVDFLRRSAYMFPEKTAVAYGERRYTYHELEERMNRLASRLRDAGLQKGDRVAFLCSNTPPMLEGHFGVPAAGMILVAINTRLGKDEVSYIVEHSGAKIVFVDAELEHLLEDLDGVEIVRVEDTGDEGDPYEEYLAEGSPEPVESVLEDEEETISINYTSGTTGRPKGVMYTHRGAYLSALVDFCKENIARFKAPAAVEFTELPKTSTGKVQKFVLRDKEWAGQEKRVH